MVIEPLIIDFWAWFANEQSKLRNIPPGEVAEIVFPRLRKIHSGIGVEVTFDGPKPELVLTAYGDANLFPLIRQIVATTPSPLDWNVVALKQARGFAFKVRFDQSSIEVSQLPFEPLVSPSDSKFFGVCLFFPNLHQSEAERLHMARVILMSGLGEERMSKIDQIDTADIGQAPPDPLRLAELEAFLDWRRRKNLGK
jgi:hypothetical protein